MDLKGATLAWTVLNRDTLREAGLSSGLLLVNLLIQFAASSLSGRGIMGRAGKPRARLIALFGFHLTALGEEQLDITLGDILDQVVIP